MDRDKMSQEHVRAMIAAIGDDPNREGVLDTPNRVVKSWSEVFKGYNQDPADILKTSFSGDGYQQMVILKDIEMYSTCEHHMLPFIGKAHVAYIPKNRVVGLSKLARLVECFSRRLQIQERLTKQIADSIQKVLDPIGVGVIIEAKHFCMMARGVNKQNSQMITSELIGAMKEDKVRQEFFSLISR